MLLSVSGGSFTRLARVVNNSFTVSRTSSVDKQATYDDVRDRIRRAVAESKERQEKEYAIQMAQIDELARALIKVNPPYVLLENVTASLYVNLRVPFFLRRTIKQVISTMEDLAQDMTAKEYLEERIRVRLQCDYVYIYGDGEVSVSYRENAV